MMQVLMSNKGPTFTADQLEARENQKYSLHQGLILSEKDKVAAPKNLLFEKVAKH